MIHVGRQEKRFNYIYLPTKDSTQQRSSLEQASAKAHWLIHKLQPIKSGEGVYSCRQANDFGGETMLSTTKDETSIRSAYVIPLDTARIESTNKLI